MDEDTKRKHDALHDEHSTAWDSLMRRTGTEWKVSLALWTALAAFLAMLLRDPLPASGAVGGLFWPVCVVSAIVFGAHFWFTCGIARGNSIDQRKLQCYEDAMRALTGVEWPEDLGKAVCSAASRSGCLGYWSHVSQLLITAALCFSAPAAICWLGASAPQPPKEPHPSVDGAALRSVLPPGASHSPPTMERPPHGGLFHADPHGSSACELSHCLQHTHLLRGANPNAALPGWRSAAMEHTPGHRSPPARGCRPRRTTSGDSRARAL